MVEDSYADATLVEEAFASIDAPVELSQVTDGRAAVELLTGRAEDGGGLPDLVFLDLGLGEMSGQEVLREIKSTPGTRRIPVIVLTDSDDERNVAETYDHHANAYVTKPHGLDALVEMAHSVAGFWGRVATLPPTDAQ